MAKRVRMSDIGARLSVSTVTVSKALSGQKGVSDELREKIISTAESMGYVKSVSQAKQQKSYMIGIIVAERYLGSRQSFYWQLYQHVSQKAIQRGCFTMIEIISDETERKHDFPKIVSDNKVDGIIIMGDFKDDYVNFLFENVRHQIVALDTQPKMGKGDSVVSNNLLGGYRMTNYLFSLGHKKIGFVGTRLATNSIDDRFLGYLKSIMEHGCEWKKEWIIDDRDRNYGKIDEEIFFELPENMPTAFFCNCDYTASLLIRKLNENGYSVPDDISVVGFDNYVPDQMLGIGITSYEINMKEMAKRAVHILIHKLNNSNYSTGMFVVQGEFVERESAVRINSPVLTV
ncbi:MAG: substrate-binding domain-containing protein [Coprococcus sp.]